MSVSVLLDRLCLDLAHRLPLHRRLSLLLRQMEVMGKMHRPVMEVMARVHPPVMAMAVEGDTDKGGRSHIVHTLHCLIGRNFSASGVWRACRREVTIPRSFFMIFHAS
jgi:hypothetical protein